MSAAVTTAVPDPAAIDAAAARIEGYVRETPVLRVAAGDLAVSPLALKLESLQHGGSFKPRGAFNTLLAAGDPDRPVIAASGGNHGIAVAFAARRLGCSAEIFVPEISSPIKQAALRELGATVTVVGRDYAEALDAMRRRRDEIGAYEVHAYDMLPVTAGQGTASREFEAQTADVSTFVIAVGGGGLISGALGWFGDRRKVVAVEPRNAPTLARALDAGAPVDVEVSGVAADSLGARRIGDIAFRLAKEHLSDVILVEDEEIREAQRLLWDRCRVLAEPGGATALAALTSGRFAPDDTVGVLVCGGNCDPASVLG